MNRPRITLHIYSSLDGRITGPFSEFPKSKKAAEYFESIGFKEDRNDSYHFQGWIYGTETGKEFTDHRELQLDELSEEIPAGDFIINQGKEKYYISFDRYGKLAWDKNTTSYADVEAHVIEVLTEQASDQYKGFLRKLCIPYIVAGKKEIDIPKVLSKLKVEYGLDNLLLGGGGVLNWSFISEGFCDEVSMIVAPSIDGKADSARLFNSRFNNNPQTLGFKLKSIEVFEEDILWIKYDVENSHDETLKEIR